MGDWRIHDWTDARIALLTELWLDGITGLEIAQRLGVSRSAVMGKLRRLDMLCRDRPSVPTMRLPRAAQLLKTTEQVSKPPKKPKRPPKTPDRYFAEFAEKPPPPPPPEPAYGTLNLLDLRHNSCRWPEGERPHYRFCGRPRHHESFYCESHSAMAHASGGQRAADRAAAQALGGKHFYGRAGVME